MADCLLTLDYELFFQKSGDASVSLLKPTAELLEVLERIGGKAVFFVDTIYLNLLKKSEIPQDAELYGKFESQLQEIVIRGHRIELHLHPHWLDVRKENNEWVFQSYKHYKLNSLTEEKIIELFQEGVELLNHIARKAVPDYAVCAFRAGGWCVEPFEKLRSAFQICGIKVDSSVVPGMRLDGEVHALDYSGLKSNAFYRFSDDVRIPDKNGKTIELPVNGYYMSRWEKIAFALGRKMNRKNAEIFGDGKGISVIRHCPGACHGAFPAGVGALGRHLYGGYFDPFERKVSQSELPFVSIVAHPKTLTLSSLRAVEYLAAKGHHFRSLTEILEKYEI